MPPESTASSWKDCTDMCSICFGVVTNDGDKDDRFRDLCPPCKASVSQDLGELSEEEDN